MKTSQIIIKSHGMLLHSCTLSASDAVGSHTNMFLDVSRVRERLGMGGQGPHLMASQLSVMYAFSIMRIHPPRYEEALPFFSSASLLLTELTPSNNVAHASFALKASSSSLVNLFMVDFGLVRTYLFGFRGSETHWEPQSPHGLKDATSFTERHSLKDPPSLLLLSCIEFSSLTF